MFFIGNEDHHIDQFGIVENNKQVTIYFQDKNKDDTFKFELNYAWVPRDRMSTVSSVGNYGVKGADSKDIPKGLTVIRGFKFNFLRTNTDHEIQDVGIMTNNGKIEVYYGDSNQDDRFSWNVRYANLKTGMIVKPILF